MHLYRCAKAVVMTMQCLNGLVTRGWETRGPEGESLDVKCPQHGDWECGRNSPAIYLFLETFSWRTEQKSFLKERRGQRIRLFWRLFICIYQSSYFLVNICSWTSYWISNPAYLKEKWASSSNDSPELDKIIFSPVIQTQDLSGLLSWSLSHPLLLFFISFSR